MAGSLYTAVFGPGADAPNNKLGNQTYADGTVLTFGTTTGTKFGSAANQKMGEYGAAPVVQPAGASELLGLNGNAATAGNATNMNSNGNSGSTLYNFNDVVKAMKQAGLLA